jgi:CRISPR type III-B/RAMP module RAMP protein Cmr1
MAQLRLTVQTITPLLMYGADNKEVKIAGKIQSQENPEIRASSIRGILRYWLRAVIGGHTSVLSDVYKAESAILGSTEQGSKIRVRVSELQTEKRKQSVLANKLRLEAFVPNSRFRITFSPHPLYDGKILNSNSDFIKAIFLMTHFGGLGRRARRGSGNLRVLEAKGYENDEMPLAYLPKDRDSLKEHLSSIAKSICDKPIGKRPEFPVFAPDATVVLLGETTHTHYEDAFDELWSVSGPYHQEGGIFGDVRPRRASAIHMRVAATQQGYVAQQTILYSGHGEWKKMKEYIDRCNREGFETVYGTSGGWE